MNILFEKFLFSYKHSINLNESKDLILKINEFIKNQFPDVFFTVFSHKYKPNSLEIIEPSEYSDQILNEIINIKSDIEITNSEFIQIKKYTMFPILDNNKKIHYIYVFNKFSSKNNNEILSFLKWLQIFFQVMTEQLIKNNQLNSEKFANLISQITHDFNSALKLLDKEITGGNKLNQYKQMINNLLFYVRDLELVFTTVDFNELILSIIENLDLPKGVEFELNLTKDIKQITIDVELINKAISEILYNAINAISINNGNIIISTQKKLNNSPFIKSDWIEIKILDTGPGIPKDFLPMIKDPFFTTFKSDGHFGLGLSNADKIILAHQGSIQIESNNNKGTTVLIYIPERCES